MKSDVISIKNKFNKVDIEKILAEVEKLAKYQELTDKQSLQLRLIAEELIGFEQGILGFSEGEIFIENKDNEYKVCLHADVKMDILDKDKAVDLSKSGKNAAYKGFKGKLRMIVDSMFSDDAVGAGMMDTSGYLINTASVYSYGSYDQAWAMSEYRDDVKKDTPEWDMLEHSILANVADDVIVGARNNSIDIIVVKKF